MECQSTRHPDEVLNRAAFYAVAILAPTGETITDDTGSAPVLRSVLAARLCRSCGIGPVTLSDLAEIVAALGGHLDVDEVLPNDGYRSVVPAFEVLETSTGIALVAP